MVMKYALHQPESLRPTIELMDKIGGKSITITKKSVWETIFKGYN
jgi:hypothetical protein